MRLWLTPVQAEMIAREALDARPAEACGLIAGIGEQARKIIPIPNTATDPQHFFRLDEQDFARSMFDIEQSGLSLIGIYHSHPTGEPVPSQTDIQQANYPETAYLIVGLCDDEPRFAVWDIRADTVNRVDLHIGMQPPPPESTLSMAQKTAILLAAVVALAFMLILSLSLLPPAPVIVAPLP
jgi:proteasome lid subunit RPN8/RPN11